MIYLEFIFQSFAHFAGSVFLIMIIGAIFIGVIAALRGKDVE